MMTCKPLSASPKHTRHAKTASLADWLDCSTLKNAPLQTRVASYAVDLLGLVRIPRLDASDSACLSVFAAFTCLAASVVLAVHEVVETVGMRRQSVHQICDELQRICDDFNNKQILRYVCGKRRVQVDCVSHVTRHRLCNIIPFEGANQNPHRCWTSQ